MEFSARQIAELLGGAIEGNVECKVSSLSKIEEGTPGSLTFLANPAYTQHIYKTCATLAIVKTSFTPDKPLPEGLTLIRVDDPYDAFAKILEIHASMALKKQGSLHNRLFRLPRNWATTFTLGNLPLSATG